jgi:polysaccharide deacetylase 2 family uncharacterized protein YibQ
LFTNGGDAVLDRTAPMMKAPTFARRPATAVTASSAASPGLPGALANPAVAAGGAALLFLVAGAGLIAVVGDPHAGAPQVKMSLDQGRTPMAIGGPLRTRLVPDGQQGAPTLGSLPPGQDVAMPGASDPLTAQIADAAASPSVSGQAIITLPQGGTLGGGTLGGAAHTTAPVRPTANPLTPAPIAGLSAPSPEGPLPVIAKDGRTPFQSYARPFHDNGKPKVALVVGGLGLNAAATRAAIERLPPEVTLSFVPYADGLQGWIDLARADGHEVLLEIPMEPLDYPNNDPGPSTLMANAPKEETVKRLDWLLSRATGYFGVTNYLGGKFVTVDPAMSVFTGALRARGLGFLDDGSATHRGMTGLPRASADTVVDEQLAADSIDRQLLTLENSALQHGQALGAGFAYPVTIAEVIHWAQGLAGRGYQLAPASAIARK